MLEISDNNNHIYESIDRANIPFFSTLTAKANMLFTWCNAYHARYNRKDSKKPDLILVCEYF